MIAVLSTGNELVDLQDTSATSSSSSFSLIPDSNRPSLISILRHLHFEVIDLGIVADTMEATTNALKKGKEQADVILTTGGTSMGVGDLLKPCLEREMKGTIHFGRVALKPGLVLLLPLPLGRCGRNLIRHKIGNRRRSQPFRPIRWRPTRILDSCLPSLVTPPARSSPFSSLSSRRYARWKVVVNPNGSCLACESRSVAPC